ncbi:DUF982 domain-containing protein [Rhizobium leguminosarum]|uniref:DUF982 domain-containing protein n=1 Tax=Rhizobium TaxID=379 RepID=UPI00138A2971|nr:MULTISPECIES: DUF982 domain-containing protein [Rhizobium]MBW8790719.1 DUF982 domain-containing protein [Rhizobium leguminosarum]MBY5444512.1 DUF982 domain-containing protein [Rhizobium leguminosarum]NDK52406.1 DUF982 domain-containing protein [Rhizobium laguerreae]
MPLNDVPWVRPVRLRLQCGLERAFTSVYDALDFLENEWPLRHGERHDRAVKTCRGALNGIIPSMVAREAFVAACLEAGMPTVLAPWKAKPAAHPPRPARQVGDRYQRRQAH